MLHFHLEFYDNGCTSYRIFMVRSLVNCEDIVANTDPRLYLLHRKMLYSIASLSLDIVIMIISGFASVDFIIHCKPLFNIFG